MLHPSGAERVQFFCPEFLAGRVPQIPTESSERTHTNSSSHINTVSDARAGGAEQDSNCNRIVVQEGRARTLIPRAAVCATPRHDETERCPSHKPHASAQDGGHEAPVSPAPLQAGRRLLRGARMQSRVLMMVMMEVALLQCTSRRARAGCLHPASLLLLPGSCKGERRRHSLDTLPPATSHVLVVSCGSCEGRNMLANGSISPSVTGGQLRASYTRLQLRRPCGFKARHGSRAAAKRVARARKAVVALALPPGEPNESVACSRAGVLSPPT